MFGTFLTKITSFRAMETPMIFEIIQSITFSQSIKIFSVNSNAGQWEQGLTDYKIQ